MTTTHTVHLDEFLTAQCAGFLNGGETWNGWAQPIFTADQLIPIRQWWDNENLGEVDGSTWEQQVTNLGNNEYILYGWTWEIDNNTCPICLTEPNPETQSCNCTWCPTCKTTNPPTLTTCRICKTPQPTN